MTSSERDLRRREELAAQNLGTACAAAAVAPCLRHGKPVAVELFWRAGGFSIGLKTAGFHVAAASNSRDFAALTYATNLGAHPTTFHCADRERKEAERNGTPHVPLVFGSGWISAGPLDEAGASIYG